MGDDNIHSTEQGMPAGKVQYTSAILNTSPAVLAGFAAIIASFAGLNFAVVVSLLVAGVVITTIVLAFDRDRITRGLRRELNKHTDITFELYNEIRRIDHKIQANIFNGLQYVKFIQEDARNPLEAATRALINTVVFKAFTPSIIHNHHCVEIKSYKNPMSYLANKKRVVLQLLYLSFTKEHIAIIETKLPPNAVLADALESYIHEAFREVIAEELMEGCRIKIRVYKEFIEKNPDDRHLVEQITKIQCKNEGYIAMIDEMLQDSHITHASVADRQIDSGCSVQDGTSLYQQVKRENLHFEQQHIGSSTTIG
jgi:hypothetical protein